MSPHIKFGYVRVIWYSCKLFVTFLCHIWYFVRCRFMQLLLFLSQHLVIDQLLGIIFGQRWSCIDWIRASGGRDCWSNLNKKHLKNPKHFYSRSYDAIRITLNYFFFSILLFWFVHFLFHLCFSNSDASKFR